MAVMPASGEGSYHHGRLREALLEAAERTVREQGPDQLSLRELAREVGVSHAAPRRHFADRQALLDALAVVGFERLHAALRDGPAADPDGGFAARLEAAVQTCLRFATRDAALLELMFAGKHRPGADDVRVAAERTFGLLDQLIHEGERTGDLEAGSATDVGTVLFATLLGLAALANTGMTTQEEMERLTERAMALILRGARPR